MHSGIASDGSSLLPALCLELCLTCGLHRKDEATRLHMKDTLFDRNLGSKAEMMAGTCSAGGGTSR